LKDKYLPQLATEKLGSFCLSEPASGSDAFALKTRAEKTADGYKINGSKMWVTNAADAGIFLIFATLDPSKGYKGITCFVAEKEWGVQIAKKEKKVRIIISPALVLHVYLSHLLCTTFCLSGFVLWFSLTWGGSLVSAHRQPASCTSTTSTSPKKTS
jgi:hypothetical protein